MRIFLAICVTLFGAVLPGFAQGGFIPGRSGRGDVTRATSILTPGQFTEYPLTIKPGEVIIAEVETSNFDSALQIVDATGKVLAENDDRREGDQNARLLYGFTQAGSYKVVVRAFKGAAGGQFELSLRRFVPQTLALGARGTHPGSPLPTYFQVISPEQQTLLMQLSSLSNSEPELTVFDPTGEPVTTTRRFGESKRQELRTAVQGSYFLRVESSQASTLALDAARVFSHTLAQNSAPQALRAGGLDLWRFQGTKGQLVRLSTLSEGALLSTSLEFIAPKDTPEEARPALLSSAITRLNTTVKATGEQVMVLGQSGMFELAVAQPQSQAVRYTLASTATVRPWSADAPTTLKETLPLGTAEFYQLTGKAGEILLLEGRSEQFDIALELFNAAGNQIASNDDSGPGRDAQIRSLLTVNGSYFLRVHAFGDGGSGHYELRRTPTPIRSLMVGGRLEGTLEASGTQIFSFTGKPGQALLLSARSTEFDTLVRVYGPDGQLLGSDDDSGGSSNSLLAFSPTREGMYTIWVSAKSMGGKYTLRLIEAD
jgi:hypothetical protein